MSESAGERILVVNADDFGRSPGINAGIIEAHERGIVTSASLMVCWPSAREAVDYAAARPSLSVGLHLDLGEWAFSAGRWTPVYERVAQLDREALAGEMRDQLERFRRLLGRDPTHLDSHQHAHTNEPAAGAASELAGELGVPLRGLTSAVRYSGEFYGQTGSGEALPEAITAEHLVVLIEGLPPGITELACHPGRGVQKESAYRAEREREVAALCDSRVREAIQREGVLLRSFAGLGGRDNPEGE